MGEIDGQTFTVGEITRELMTAYSDLVRNHAEVSASAAGGGARRGLQLMSRLTGRAVS